LHAHVLYKSQGLCDDIGADGTFFE